jgi:hypothetical protein
MLLEERTERTTCIKRLDVNCHVSGKFGELLPAEDGNRRWKRAHLCGTVIDAIVYKCCHVLFDNNEVKECYSNSLRFEAATASLPPDLPPLPQWGKSRSDNENLEHLPPQEQAEEEEVAEEAEAKVPEAEDTEAEGGQQLPTGEEAGGRHLLLIGQLPCIAEANPPNYHERKWLAEGRIWCLLGNQVTITKAIIPWFGLLFLIIVTPTVKWKKMDLVD